MHQRIAEVLGWTIEETRSFSLSALRDIVRPVNAKLTRELDIVIRNGSYIVQEQEQP